jgi:hypothetical protein
MNFDLKMKKAQLLYDLKWVVINIAYKYIRYIKTKLGQKIMDSILKEIDKVRQKLRRGTTDTLLQQKSFAEGMYRFSMFMIDYYSRVREHLKIDYDSFIIIQTVVSNNLYVLNKKKNTFKHSYEDLEAEWDENNNEKQSIIDTVMHLKVSKLTISSICLVTGLPKETVRRKVSALCKKNLLKNPKEKGVLLGPSYKKVFQEFVPSTTQKVSKLLKIWEKSGVLKNLLLFKF